MDQSELRDHVDLMLPTVMYLLGRPPTATPHVVWISHPRLQIPVLEATPVHGWMPGDELGGPQFGIIEIEPREELPGFCGLRFAYESEANVLVVRRC